MGHKKCVWPLVFEKFDFFKKSANSKFEYQKLLLKLFSKKVVLRETAPKSVGYAPKKYFVCWFVFLVKTI